MELYNFVDIHMAQTLTAAPDYQPGKRNPLRIVPGDAEQNKISVIGEHFGTFVKCLQMEPEG